MVSVGVCPHLLERVPSPGLRQSGLEGVVSGTSSARVLAESCGVFQVCSWAVVATLRVHRGAWSGSGERSVVVMVYPGHGGEGSCGGGGVVVNRCG